MKRLTYDFCIGGNHCWQVKGADNLECREVCERQGDDGCKTCPIAKAFDRLAAIEDILGDDYDLDRLKILIEEARGEKWISNKPIQQITVKCGWGIASIEFSLLDAGKYFTREAAEIALKGEQDG